MCRYKTKPIPVKYNGSKRLSRDPRGRRPFQ
jgi:hypothetical protein